jgi:FkbH-like protein
MVRVDLDDDVRPYLLKVRFKRWGKLWTVGNLTGYTPSESLRRERSSLLVGALARSVPLPQPLKSKVLGKVSYLRRTQAERAPHATEIADCFVIECYNPASKPVDLTVTVRARSDERERAFQHIVRVPPGFVRERIASERIQQRVDLSGPFEIEVLPNDVDDTVLYFGLMDFVWLTPTPADAKGAERKAGIWKCIVWDLDNTLWDGTLIEDGPEHLRLREHVVEVIKEVDRRGVLQSIASKNNREEALQLLRSWDLEKYFLYPQISWDPKSQAVGRVAQLLNIGADTLAFVDDQPFEREEVRSALPQVTALDASDVPTLLSRRELEVPITAESRQRRAMYQQEAERKLVEESFQGDYHSFLRECRIELTIERLTDQNLERVYELAQRTNQMNFSGSRYPRDQLVEIGRSAERDTYVIRCNDRFGSYGIVGFAVMDVTEPRLLDLMFSCRIQGKRVEHAFLAYLLETFNRTDRRDFFANYRQTKKNEKPGKVFEELGFEIVDRRDDLLSLRFSSTRQIPQDGIIQINGGVASAAA